MQILLEEHADQIVATIPGQPGCGVGPDRETALRRLHRVSQACTPSPFATVRKRLGERTGQGTCHARR